MTKFFAVVTAASLALTTSIALANQADRRAAMKEIGAASKAIRGGTDVAANAQKIAEIAVTVPALFETEEITGDSEALPAIWQNFDDFTAKAAGLEQAALAVVAAADSGGDIAAAGQALGGACGACHKSYKK